MHSCQFNTDGISHFGESCFRLRKITEMDNSPTWEHHFPAILANRQREFEATFIIFVLTNYCTTNFTDEKKMKSHKTRQNDAVADVFRSSSFFGLSRKNSKMSSVICSDWSVRQLRQLRHFVHRRRRKFACVRLSASVVASVEERKRKLKYRVKERERERKG